MIATHPGPSVARLSSRKLAAIIAVGVAVLAGAVVPALAKERQTMRDGVRACKAFCDRNNTTIGSQHSCYVRCERYWMCNGRDSTTTTCADKPALAQAETPTPQPPSHPTRPARAPTRPTASSN